MRPRVIDTRVQSADFEPGRQLARLGELRKAAVASFVGRVEAGADVSEIWIDHHAALAKAELLAIGEEAVGRWPLAGLILIHRHGRFSAGERMAFAAVASHHRTIALEACAFLVDALATRAPFWRKTPDED